MKILFLAPHLSTGGMPEFLLKRVKSLIKNKDVEIWVVEYSTYSLEYVTHRSQIIEQLEEGKFISLGSFTNDYQELEEKSKCIKSLVKTQKFDIIHIECFVETFDTFNPISDDLLNFLYSDSRTWKIVETQHAFLDPSTFRKKYIPDGLCHCSEVYLTDKFVDLNSNIPTINIEYPVEEKSDSKLTYPFANKVNCYNILNVGIWSPHKNQNYVIEIAKFLEDLYPGKYLFHLVGIVSSSFENYWKSIINNLPSNVTLWYERNDISRFYQHSDLIIHSSLNELNPLVLKEAISYRKKLIINPLDVYMKRYDKLSHNLTGDYMRDSYRVVELLEKPNTIMESNKLQLSTSIEAENNFSNMHTKFYKRLIEKDNPRLNTKNDTLPFNIDLNDGLYLEIKNDPDVKLGSNVPYDVKFINDKTNELVYQIELSKGFWAKPFPKYFIPWRVEVEPKDLSSSKKVWKLNLTDKIVRINFESSSLGDTLAWMPYVEEFQKIHKCKLICSTYKNYLFKGSYPTITFIEPNQTVDDTYATYRLGWFFDDEDCFDQKMHPGPFNSQPLQKTSSDILGVTYQELLPKLALNTSAVDTTLPERYFTFSIQATAQCKYWNNITGWEDLIKQLDKEGLKGVCVDQFQSFGNQGYMNTIPSSCINKTGHSLESTSSIIKNGQFHIGTSSGLSWLAWALNHPVVLISGFTEPTFEFQNKCLRIHNKNKVCNSCFNDPNLKFDSSDWLWCPKHRGTDREFECTKTITPEQVFKEIKDKLL